MRQTLGCNFAVEGKRKNSCKTNVSKKRYFLEKSFQNRANNLECLYPESIRKGKESLNPILDKRFFYWYAFWRKKCRNSSIYFLIYFKIKILNNRIVLLQNLNSKIPDQKY